MKWLKRFKRKQKYAVCDLCRRVNPRGEACGTLKVEHQDFGDGGWVEWKSWNPCSEHAPGGATSLKVELDDPGDLDLMRELSSGIYSETVR